MNKCKYPYILPPTSFYHRFLGYIYSNVSLQIAKTGEQHVGKDLYEGDNGFFKDPVLAVSAVLHLVRLGKVMKNSGR